MFTSSLCAQILKVQKDSQCPFALLGSAHVEAACKTFVKLASVIALEIMWLYHVISILVIASFF